MTRDAGTGGLSARELRAQVRSSVESLNGKRIRTLYLHAPDSETRLEDALEECERLRREENAFEDVGLSNFSAWETVMACQICERNGWKRPTMYQGMYNALTRNVESELVPAVRACGMRALGGATLITSWPPRGRPSERRRATSARSHAGGAA